MTLYPKPTTYKGVEFRSRFDARWAFFMDIFAEPWEYRPEMPALWLPRLRCLLTILVRRKNGKVVDMEPYYRLAVATKKPVVFAIDLPHAAIKYYYDEYNRPLSAEEAEVVMAEGDPVYEGYDARYLQAYLHEAAVGECWWAGCFWAVDKAGKICLCSNATADKVFSAPFSHDPFPGIVSVEDIDKPITSKQRNAARDFKF